MKAVVTVTFIDKTTNEQKFPGNVIEASESRIEELESKGFVKAVAVEKPVAAVKASRKAKRSEKNAE